MLQSNLGNLKELWETLFQLRHFTAPFQPAQMLLSQPAQMEKVAGTRLFLSHTKQATQRQICSFTRIFMPNYLG